MVTLHLGGRERGRVCEEAIAVEVAKHERPVVDFSARCAMARSVANVAKRRAAVRGGAAQPLSIVKVDASELKSCRIQRAWDTMP